MAFQKFILNRRVINDLQKRSALGILFYLIVPYVLLFTDGYIQRHPTFSTLFLGAFTVICLFRLIHFYILNNKMQKYETLNNKIFITSVIFTALIWGLGSAYCLVEDGEHSLKLLVVICTTGFCSGGVVSFMPERRLAISYNLLMLLPAAAVLFFKGEDFTLGVVMLLYSAYLILITIRGNNEYWTALENEFLLEKKTQELKLASRIDVLTGIYNRRHFDELFNLAWGFCTRHNRSMTLIICDIDHFKKVNDTYGHLAGDEYLKLISRNLLRVFQRETDIVARYGGEEFIILMSDKDSHTTLQLAERFRKMVAETSLNYKGDQIKTTVSLGLASLIPQPGQNRDTMITMADTALYKAKHAGRNKIMIHEGVDG